VLHEDEVLTEGALRKFTPPARIRTEADRAAMWDLVARGELDMIASDHAPSTREQKSTGDIWSVPFGLPGLDTTFAVLLDAVSAGAITAQQVAEVYSNRPATHFGLAGKGRIAPGYDADLALVDPDEVWTVDDADVLSHAGWSPFAGRRLRGRAVLTMLRGEVVCEDGVVSPERVGRFVPGLGARVAAAPAR
jgi:dihydroorotase-like cyclic amidohydrolase